MSFIFTRCVKIVEAGLVSAGLPCSRLVAVNKYRLTRQLCVKIVLQLRCQFVISKVEERV